MGYSHPSDLHLTLCGDGKDLSSGYTFQFAAHNNSVTRLLRREQVVTENRQVRMVNPTRAPIWRSSGTGFHLRVEKEGRLRCYVGWKAGVRLRSDPQPLPAARGGALDLAQRPDGGARFGLGGEAGPAEPASRPAGSAPSASVPLEPECDLPPALTCDFERDAAAGPPKEVGWPFLPRPGEPGREGRSLRVTNPFRRQPGRPMRRAPVRRGSRILQFDYRMDPRARQPLPRVGRQGWCSGLSAAQNCRVIAAVGLAPSRALSPTGSGTGRVSISSAPRQFYPTATTILVEIWRSAAPR